MKIASLTVDHVARLIRDLERRGLAPTTVQAYIQPLRGVMSYAVRRGLRAGNPCDQLTRDDRPQQHDRRETHVWSDEEIQALIEAAEELAQQPESRYDYSPLLCTALSTGLRLGELLGLIWADIDLADGALNVRRQWTRSSEYGPTKTKAAVRRAPLSADMVSYLREIKLRSAHSQAGDPVFAGKSGKPLQHRNATRRGFEPAAKKASIEGVSFHDTRHAFASRMISRGVDPIMLAKLLGHESPVITLATYTHLFDRQRTDDVVRLAMAWGA